MFVRVRWRDKPANYVAHLTLIIGLAFIQGAKYSDATEIPTLRSKFQCSSEAITHRPMESFLLKSKSTFETPCSCLADWNQQFCNQTNSLLSPRMLNDLPTVCICRKFNDNGSKCQQFISRCYKKENGDCSCCFNQPREWCNHLKCRNNEPDFGGANTTCICHHSPSDYPYQICKSASNPPRDNRNPSPLSVIGIRRHHHVDNRPESFVIFGQEITSEMFMYVIGSLLVALILLTLFMIVAGNRKLKRRRNSRERERNHAQQTLLMQRREDDRYLPSA